MLSKKIMYDFLRHFLNPLFIRLLTGKNHWSAKKVVTKNQNIKINDPMHLASKLDASTTIDFRNFTVLSNGTEFARTLELS